MKLSVLIPAYNQEYLVIKALESIPARDDIETIVIDDGSTDGTFNKVESYRNNNEKNIALLYNEENRGVAYTVNRLLDVANGEYVVLLGSDDYFITEDFEKAINELDGTDLVYFNLRVNNGDIWKLTKESKNTLCGSVKFMRKEFVGNTRCPENKKAGEDAFFYAELLKKNPTEKFTDITCKHYNFPREGSLINLLSKGVIK